MGGSNHQSNHKNTQEIMKDSSDVTQHHRTNLDQEEHYKDHQNIKGNIIGGGHETINGLENTGNAVFKL